MIPRTSTYLALLCSLSLIQGASDAPQNTSEKGQEQAFKRIRKIVFEGNKLVTEDALRARIPYSEGNQFNPSKTSELIRNLYGLNYFNTITLETLDVGPQEVDLYIVLKEKKKIESVTYQGTSILTKEELEKELKLSDVPTMDEEELALYADQIKQLYAQKNYHATTISTQLEPTERGTFTATFTINEGKKAAIRKVIIRGNESLRASSLRSLLFTREEWIFGFVNKAGTYIPEMLDRDKYVLESHYQSQGFLAAVVSDIRVDTDPVTQEMTVTFIIEEGPQFKVASVSAPGNDLIKEENLLKAVPIKPGDLYSREKIRETMDRLRSIWGRFGYIYADIDPIIIPDFEKKTVAITFKSELGTIFSLNRVDIVGNTKTRDYVIRRMLSVAEGQVLTIPAMDQSKARIESLGFFDKQEGVDWKITKISDTEVDLELLLKEIKTGNIGGQITYGGADPQSPSSSIRIGASISERNIFGTGIRANFSTIFSKQDRTVFLNVFQPWLFGRPVGGGLGFQHRSSVYDEFENISTNPKENYTEFDTNLLFYVPGYPDVSTSVSGGVERIHFQKGLRANISGLDRSALMQTFIDRRFSSGTTGFVGISLGQDLRNHPMFPNRGYNWTLSSRLGIPSSESTFGYIKTDLDATWHTPLIGDYDLVFLLHGHAGIVTPLRDKLIPYRDLYNMGGPGTVRGFEFGQIGPQLFGSSVGAQKAFWVNAELIFSITEDQGIRGLVFYDGGAGWDTPLSSTQKTLLAQPANSGALTNNTFQYRHAVGFGLRLLRPAPVRVDWAFKLDRNRRKGEKFYEVHFSMNQDF